MAALVVAIDANVLLAAMLSPQGASRKLLELAAIGLFRPIITSEVLAECERHCRLGIQGRIVTEEEVLAFREAVAPLMEYEHLASGPVGRAASERAPLVNVDNRAIIQPDPGSTGHPRGTRKQTEAVSDTRAFIRDMGDAHVLAAAIRHACDYVCTGNTRDFPATFEMRGMRFIAPSQLLALLLDEGDGEDWA